MIIHNDMNIANPARRLGRNFINHWWQHATQRDLLGAEIYDYVRSSVAYHLRRTLDVFLDGLAVNRGSTTIVLLKSVSRA